MFYHPPPSQSAHVWLCVFKFKSLPVAANQFEQIFKVIAARRGRRCTFPLWRCSQSESESEASAADAATACGGRLRPVRAVCSRTRRSHLVKQEVEHERLLSPIRTRIRRRTRSADSVGGSVSRSGGSVSRSGIGLRGSTSQQLLDGVRSYRRALLPAPDGRTELVVQLLRLRTNRHR